MPPLHGFDFFALLLTFFWVWMLIDAFSNNRLRGNSKVGWLIFIFFTHTLGAAIYFFTARARSRQNQFPPNTQYQSNPQQYTPNAVSSSVPYYQPSRPASEAIPEPEAGSDYREGYQGAIGIQTLTPYPEPASRADWQGDEHPTAAYPIP